ncbi:hypothetical protein KY314_01060 [Candidatus Woesearchaeota archaeon]|nr:hypothetical protein [Candidatus Woesearchaeota archaeon]
MKYWADKRVPLKELALRRLDNRVGKRSLGETRACDGCRQSFALASMSAIVDIIMNLKLLTRAFSEI